MTTLVISLIVFAHINSINSHLTNLDPVLLKNKLEDLVEYSLKHKAMQVSKVVFREAGKTNGLFLHEMNFSGKFSCYS